MPASAIRETSKAVEVVNCFPSFSTYRNGSGTSTGTSWRISGELTESAKISTSGTAGGILPAVHRLAAGGGGVSARPGAHRELRRGGPEPAARGRRDLRRARPPRARHRRPDRR